MAKQSLFELIQQKLELFRLEKRYTKRRNRRSTFVSDAMYVDGEYIYSPTSPSYTANCTGGTTSSMSDDDRSKGGQSKASKRMSRLGLDKIDWRKAGGDKGVSGRESRVSVREVRFEGSA